MINDSWELCDAKTDGGTPAPGWSSSEDLIWRIMISTE